MAKTDEQLFKLVIDKLTQFETTNNEIDFSELKENLLAMRKELFRKETELQQQNKIFQQELKQTHTIIRGYARKVTSK